MPRQHRARNCYLQEGVMEPQFSCVLLTGSKQVYHFTFGCCMVCLPTVIDKKNLQKNPSAPLQSCWRTVILCKAALQGSSPGGVSPWVQALCPSFGYNARRLLGVSKTGSTKADTKVAKRKGWGEGIKPKPLWNFTLCLGPDSQQSISEGLAPHQCSNFWYKTKRR